MEMWTLFDRVDALLNKFKYLTAKLNETGSSTSQVTYSSYFSESFDLILIVPPPISPYTENLIPSLDVSIETIDKIYRIITCFIDLT